LFDVTLRDGIQNADPLKWTTDRKKEVLRNIASTENPVRMEVGSLVSSKILPILSDSLQLYQHAEKTLSKNETEIYMLIPSLTRLSTALNYNIANMSFITSVSNAFQQKNTNRTIEETKQELLQIDTIVNDTTTIRKKLYISCIGDCPIIGKQDMDYVLREVMMYHNNYRFDELCLSDTCGTLTFEDYEYLLDGLLLCGVPASKISLHLHVSDNNLANIRCILWYSFDKNVNKFDVSMLETGGCSVTMNKERLHPNLSYDLFYRILDQYIHYHSS
jgi:isopropylmalate/homocitrate/citramalate synthase